MPLITYIRDRFMLEKLAPSLVSNLFVKSQKIQTTSMYCSRMHVPWFGGEGLLKMYLGGWGCLNMCLVGVCLNMQTPPLVDRVSDTRL